MVYRTDLASLLLRVSVFLKRFFDIVFAVAGLGTLSPLLFSIACRIRREHNGPVFYRGERVGLHGKPFRIYKFRTMVVDAEKLGASSTSDDDPRITRIGKFLRKYKLDELPQLINVLKGEMSFVGPRPQVKWAVDLYTLEEKTLLNVKPGITDYASLRFPNEGEILKGSNDPDKDYMEKIHPEKTRLSLEYLRNRSFGLDLRVILESIVVLFKPKPEGR
jgi:lipopolysaccharide/colanic/teichoic acid biosynthesis glycosyltransferase